jgi:carbon storage regulator
MLVLSRKVGESILIGEDISVTVVRIGPAGVRIGIDAPNDLVVVREELTAETVAVGQHDGGQHDGGQHNAEQHERPRVLPR